MYKYLVNREVFLKALRDKCNHKEVQIYKEMGFNRVTKFSNYSGDHKLTFSKMLVDRRNQRGNRYFYILKNHFAQR